MTKFIDLGLISEIQRALNDEGYTTPTPIQSETIPPALDGRDILGSAPTGTGKTAAYSLPILNRIGKQNRKPSPHYPQALILAPTRELAVQIGDSLATYGRHLRVRQAVIYGGVGQHHQVRALKRGVHVVVATPGRLLDLLGQGHLDLGNLEVFVLDEADRMMDMGFLPDLKRIIGQLPEDRQSLFFSATLAPKIIELAESLLVDPVSVTVAPPEKDCRQIEQRVLFVDRGAKQAILQKILGETDVRRTLIFAKTKHGANTITTKLIDAGIRASVIHGNKTQAARQKALEQFRSGRVQALIATDVAARGIDVDGITHVINFDVPLEAESYVHRIGRTGRAGADGIAMTFCSSQEHRELRAIEQLLGERIPVDPNYPRTADHSQDSTSRKRPGKASHRKSRNRPTASGTHESRKGSGGMYGDQAARRKPRRKSARPKKGSTDRKST